VSEENKVKLRPERGFQMPHASNAVAALVSMYTAMVTDLQHDLEVSRQIAAMLNKQLLDANEVIERGKAANIDLGKRLLDLEVQNKDLRKRVTILEAEAKNHVCGPD
jgi:hypothetical protein